MGENLNGNWSYQQSLEQQHHEINAQNGFNQCSFDEMTIEDILVIYGVVKRGNNSSRTISSRPSPPTEANTSSLPTHQTGGSMGEKQSNQQSCAQNDFCQTSHEDVMSFEDFLVQSGVLPREYSSHTTSFKSPPPPPPPNYDPSSLLVGAEGTSVNPMESGAAHKDHQSPESIRRVWHENHQSPGNITNQVCPTGGRMETMGTGVQQTEVGDGDQLGRAMRRVSLEGMRHGGGGGSSGIKGIEGLQLGVLGSSASAMAMAMAVDDDLSIEPEPYNNAKGMGGETSGNKKCNEAKTDKETEKKKKNMIKNRESASRSRARKEAYMMELERTVRQLIEENARLKRDLEELKAKPEHIKAGKAGALRRCNSFPY